MSKHTPGPWKVSNLFDIYQDVGPQYGGTYIGTTRGNGDLPASIERVDAANAKLIAAAPEMLALIWKIYQGLHCQNDSFAGMTDSEITDAINDEMHNLLGDQWESMKAGEL